MLTHHALSHAEAMNILCAVKGELERQGLGAAVAVVDSHGELLAFVRTDGCRVSCIAVAINKAYTAARECRESKSLGDAAREQGFPLTNYGELRYVTWGGGVPIRASGQVVGAVGVSGLTEDEDIALAAVGVAAGPR